MKKYIAFTLLFGLLFQPSRAISRETSKIVALVSAVAGIGGVGYLNSKIEKLEELAADGLLSQKGKEQLQQLYSYKRIIGLLSLVLTGGFGAHGLGFIGAGNGPKSTSSDSLGKFRDLQGFKRDGVEPGSHRSLGLRFQEGQEFSDEKGKTYVVTPSLIQGINEQSGGHLLDKWTPVSFEGQLAFVFSDWFFFPESDGSLKKVSQREIYNSEDIKSLIDGDTTVVPRKVKYFLNDGSSVFDPVPIGHLHRTWEKIGGKIDDIKTVKVAFGLKELLITVGRMDDAFAFLRKNQGTISWTTSFKALAPVSVYFNESPTLLNDQDQKILSKKLRYPEQKVSVRKYAPFAWSRFSLSSYIEKFLFKLEAKDKVIIVEFSDGSIIISPLKEKIRGIKVSESYKEAVLNFFEDV